MVNHSYFNFISSLVISINVVYMGIVINDHAVKTIHQYSTHGWTPFLEMATPQWESKMDWFFTLLFTLEIAMRILGEECEFFFGPDWNWNCMDLLLVVTNMVEIVLTSLQRSLVDLELVRLLRLMRVVRTLRSVRMLRVLQRFSKFRTLLHAMQNCLSPLTWACVLLFWMVYMASLVFLNGVTDYFLSGEAEHATAQQLMDYFGALDSCLLTLFMSISGGLSWELAIHALMHIHFAYGLLFVLFIASMMLAVLNIFSGIFVNDAIELSQMDRDNVSQMESKRNQVMIKDLMDLFRESDNDNSGTLSRKEFMAAFEAPKLLSKLGHLGVELTDVEGLFEMLGISEDDELVIDEFVNMCLCAKTLKRPVDLQSFIQQNRRNTDHFRRGLTKIESRIESLREKIEFALKPTPETSPVARTQHPSSRKMELLPQTAPRGVQRQSPLVQSSALHVRTQPSSRDWLA